MFERKGQKFGSIIVEDESAQEAEPESSDESPAPRRSGRRTRKVEAKQPEPVVEPEQPEPDEAQAEFRSALDADESEK